MGKDPVTATRDVRAAVENELRARRRPRRRGPALPADPVGTVSTVPYNHYSLLRSIEDIFGLPHLGNAATARVRSFGPDVFG